MYCSNTDQQRRTNAGLIAGAVMAVIVGVVVAFVAGIIIFAIITKYREHKRRQEL